jgi:hypothetical protein
MSDELLKTPGDVRREMLAWLHRRWSVSRSYQMTTFLRQLEVVADEPYDPPFCTAEDVKLICSATWGSLGSREKGEVWKRLWHKFGSKEYGFEEQPSHYWDPMTLFSPEPKSVRETLLISRIEVEGQKADSWQNKTRSMLERLKLEGATDADLMHYWDAFVEANPAEDGIDPDAWAAVLAIYKREYSKLVSP